MLDTIPKGIHATRLAPSIGAVVRGVALAEELPEAMVGEITDLLLRHHVLFFEHQDLTPARQRAFAERFGDLHIHPLYPNVKDVPEIIILDTHAGNPPDNDNWHTDVTFIQTPPMGAVLAAKVLPPSGGDTIWASTIAAYEALSPALQTFLCGLNAVHDIAKSFPPERYAEPGDLDRWNEARRRNAVVVHPVIRTHPATGLKGIFVNEGFTTAIVGLTRKESDAILGFVFAHVARPEFTVRWSWKPGDVAFWDNRVTQHYALADYLPHRRLMHRATILGDRPF